MTKPEFLQAVCVRCANMQGAKPFYMVQFALQIWEAPERYGDGSSGDMAEPQMTAGVTGPRSIAS